MPEKKSPSHDYHVALVSPETVVPDRLKIDFDQQAVNRSKVFVDKYLIIHKDIPPDELPGQAGYFIDDLRSSQDHRYSAESFLGITQSFEHADELFDVAQLAPKPSGTEDVAIPEKRRSKIRELGRTIAKSYYLQMRSQPRLLNKKLALALFETSIGRELFTERISDFLEKPRDEMFIDKETILQGIDKGLGSVIVSLQIKRNDPPCIENGSRAADSDVYKHLLVHGDHNVLLRFRQLFPEYDSKGEYALAFLKSIDTTQDQSLVNELVEKIMSSPEVYHLTYDQIFLAFLDTQKGKEIFKNKISNDIHGIGKLDKMVAVKAIVSGCVEVVLRCRDRFNGVSQQAADHVGNVFSDELWGYIKRYATQVELLAYADRLPQFDGAGAYEFLENIPQNYRKIHPMGRAVDEIFEHPERFKDLVLDKALAEKICESKHHAFVVSNAEKFSDLDRSVALLIARTTPHSGVINGLIEEKQKYFKDFKLDEDFFEAIARRPEVSGQLFDTDGSLLDKFVWIKEQLGEDLYKKVRGYLIELVRAGDMPHFSTADWKYLLEDPRAEQVGLVVMKKNKDMPEDAPPERTFPLSLRELNVVADNDENKLLQASLTKPEGGKILFESLCQGAILANKTSEASVWADDHLMNPVRQAGDIFGYDRMLRYALRERLTRHDAYVDMSYILELFRSTIPPGTPEKQLRKYADRFYGNILQQVMRDDAVYDEGSAQQHFGSVAKSLHGVAISDALKKAHDSKIDSLKALASTFSTIESVFQSWPDLRRFINLHEILQREDILPSLEALYAEAVTTDDETKKKLAMYIDTLAFHRYSKVNLHDVLQFWREPERVFGAPDKDGLTDFHEQKKTSHYLEVPHLDLSATDIRDAIVGGKLDALQVVRPFDVSYRIDTRVFNRTESFSRLVSKAVGSFQRGIKAESRNPKKLREEIEKVLVQYPEVTMEKFFENLEDTHIPTALRYELERLLWYTPEGFAPKPEEQRIFRAKITKKSDPEGALAGNDTACCMAFGEGKYWDFLTGLNNGQFLVQQEPVVGDKLRTVAQSVMTKDRPVTNLPKLIEAMREQSLVATYALLTEEVLIDAPQYVVADNIEVNPNFLGKTVKDGILNEAILKCIYGDYFAEYLGRFAEEDRVVADKVPVGVGYADALTSLPPETNVYLPQVPLTYSDNLKDKNFVLKPAKSEHYIEKTVKEIPLERKKLSPIKTPNVSYLTFEDTLPVVYLKNKYYQGDEEALSRVVDVENALAAKDISNGLKDRPNMSVKYKDDQGAVRGYVLAYEGLKDKEGERVVHVRDITVDPQSVASEKSLLQGFAELYRKNYLDQNQPTSLHIEVEREQNPSYGLLASLQEVGEKIGYTFEIEEGDSFYKNERTLVPLTIRPVKK